MTNLKRPEGISELGAVAEIWETETQEQAEWTQEVKWLQDDHLEQGQSLLLTFMDPQRVQSVSGQTAHLDGWRPPCFFAVLGLH